MLHSLHLRATPRVAQELEQFDKEMARRRVVAEAAELRLAMEQAAACPS